MRSCVPPQKFPKNTPPRPLRRRPVHWGLRIFRYKAITSKRPAASQIALSRNSSRGTTPAASAVPGVDTAPTRYHCSPPNMRPHLLPLLAAPAAVAAACRGPGQVLHRRPGLPGQAVAWVLQGEGSIIWRIRASSLCFVAVAGRTAPTPTPMANENGEGRGTIT
jgi:hypothetical protein